MRSSRRLAVALAGACLFAGPALAAPAGYTLSSDWQQVAAGGASYLVAGSNIATITTGSTTPGAAAVGVPAAGQCVTLPGGTNLYARGSGSLSVVDGVTCVGSSGGGTSSSVTVTSSALPTGAAQDGTDASAATAPSGGAGIRGWLSGIYNAVTSALTIKPSVITLTSTEVPVAAATSTQLLPSNTSRKYASFVVDGVNYCRVNYGSAATATNGEPFEAAAASGHQGGGKSFESSVLTQQAIYAYCPAASSFAVIEGQ